jgi:hypothetical protein
MQDFRDDQVRYLIHFSDGGSGMRFRDEQLKEGGGTRDRVDRVEQPAHARTFG